MNGETGSSWISRDSTDCRSFSLLRKMKRIYLLREFFLAVYINYKKMAQLQKITDSINFTNMHDKDKEDLIQNICERHNFCV